MTPRTILICAFVACHLLAGCLGGDGDDSSPDFAGPVVVESVPMEEGGAAAEARAQAEAEPAPSATGTALGYPLDGDYYQRLWLNGSFSAAQGDTSGGLCTVESCNEYIDITDAIPTDVPVTVRLELRYDPGPIPFRSGFMQAWFAGDYVRHHSPSHSALSGHVDTKQVVHVEPGQQLQVGLYYGRSAEPGQDLEYTLSVTVEAASSRIPAGVPTAFEAGPGTEVLLQAADNGGLAFVLYDPAGAVAGRNAGTGASRIILGPEADAGEYVLLLLQDSAPATLTGGKGGDLWPVGYRVQLGDSVPVAPAGPSHATLTTSGSPVRVGYVIKADTNAAPIGGRRWMPYTVLLEGPEGPVGQGDYGPGCIICGRTGHLLTDLGLPEVAAGDYTATLSPSMVAKSPALEMYVYAHYLDR